MSAPILSIKNLIVRYGSIEALSGVSLEVMPGELVALIGSNGSGKTSMLKTISGQMKAFSGDILFSGQSISGAPAHKVTGRGIAHCPEGRKVFATQSVEDNLLLGAFLRSRKETRKEISFEMDAAFEMFPILKERRHQLAGTLSGGQQQMLAIARALMSKPQLLMLDEPSMGLAPIIIDEVFSIIQRLRDSKKATVLLVEQLAFRALQVADRAYVLEQGHIRLTGTGSELLGHPEVRKAYLGNRAAKGDKNP